MPIPDERPDKRQKILSAAKSLFNRAHDFQRVSLEDIAEEAGVSPTTIYNYFGNRETLVYEVIKEFVNRNIELSRALLRSDLPFAQKLISIIGSKMDIAEKVNREIIEKLVSKDKINAAFINDIYEREIKPLWQEMVADGKKQGYIDPSLDDNALLVYLDVLRAGFIARPELLQGFQNNPGFIEQLTRLMFYGFLTKDIGPFPEGGKIIA